jgi:cytochrome P450
MLIPKDTTLFCATWAIHHLENIYDDPETFNPDRYLSHPKLANDYAGSPDWEHRDKFSLTMHRCSRDCLEPRS